MGIMSNRYPKCEPNSLAELQTLIATNDSEYEDEYRADEPPQIPVPKPVCLAAEHCSMKATTMHAPTPKLVHPQTQPHNDTPLQYQPADALFPKPLFSTSSPINEPLSRFLQNSNTCEIADRFQDPTRNMPLPSHIQLREEHPTLNEFERAWMA